MQNDNLFYLLCSNLFLNFPLFTIHRLHKFLQFGFFYLPSVDVILNCFGFIKWTFRAHLDFDDLAGSVLEMIFNIASATIFLLRIVIIFEVSDTSNEERRTSVYDGATRVADELVQQSLLLNLT